MDTKKKSDLNDFATVKISQKHEFLPLKACIIANPYENYLPPYNEATKSYTDHLPAEFKDAIINKVGDRPKLLSQVLPKWHEAIVKSTDELEAVYKKYGIKVYRSYEAAPEIRNYFGYMEAGYWSYGVADNWKVMGDVFVELAPADNIRAINPQIFEYRDVIWKAFENTPGASWVSMPPAAPSNPLVSAGRGPFVVGADIKVLDEKNILVGCGVESAADIKNANHNRSAMNEDGVMVFKAFAERLGYTVHQAYYDSHVSFHMDTIFGLVRPGVVAFPKDALFVVPDYLTENFEIIDVPLDECIRDLSGNMVNINEKTVVVNARAEKTIKILEAQGMTVEAIDYWAGAALGTGPWCSTCAIWRE
jgi:hypothetical protein